MTEESRWCGDCRQRVRVEQRFDDTEFTRYGEVGFTITILDCGHSIRSGDTVIAAAPGEPYAGTKGARTLRDLRRGRTTDL